MKFGVIGLGRFGYEVAVTLAANGMEVLGVDSNEHIVAMIRDHVTQAVCLKIDNEDSLISIGIQDMDIVIVAMGENFAQSVLVTALLKKRLKIGTVITRAISSIHKEILQLIGADQIVLPEQEVGLKLADSLSAAYGQLTRISDDFGVSQITAPTKFIDKTIEDLDLFNKYHATCIGVKDEHDRIEPVGPQFMVRAGDRLLFAGKVDALHKIAKLS